MGTEWVHHMWGGARLCAWGEHPQKSQLHKTRREESWLPQCSESQKCLQLPGGGGRRICVAGPLGDLSKGRQVFFPEPNSEGTSLDDTGHTRVLGAFWSIIAFYNVSDTSLCDWPPSVCVCWVVWSPMAASSYQIAFWNFLFSLIIPFWFQNLNCLPLRWTCWHKYVSSLSMLGDSLCMWWGMHRSW